MSSLPPRPPSHDAHSIPKNVNRLAKRDPQLYPLAAIMLVTVGAAAYFLSARPTGADTGHAKPMIPSKIKEEVQKHDSAGNLKKTS
ncbi:hypothetical protein RSOLAG1IB_09738 [Rhizoctonia solani AG-1 IB]|uniref:Transmembrane protein n=2 Tax=Rhizoctonia solani TaxID=456999 RepID=M5C5D1_THACB|nr:unnamed protein product [Rhizoctonia solani]CCO34529.1 hypothetical protein BN14_08631 [Rhizoctonia solani AG-1 IB]CEL60556.1 hypothetical protein RSOLAG1IB_09738 [Rhizoctonia solani AG-1 IB]